MDTRRISPDVSVCGQLTSRDLTNAKSLGFQSILCNRPDGEASDQPLFATIAQAADLAGMNAHYVPVPPAGPGHDQIARLRDIWDGLPKPVLAYCRTGGRSAALINAALAGQIDG